MMKKKHQPTAQDLYRARKQREEQEKDARLPPGFINHGNTCFMNSTLQGLLATEPLHNLVKFQPLTPTLQSTFGSSIVAKRSPQLTNGHGLGGEYEHPWVEGMPLGDVFSDVMRKAWDIQEGRTRQNMSPKEVLFTIGKKYDQYLDFRQQDAHEFLRHMLDAMRMEELDIIKQRQPPPKGSRKRARRKRTLPPAPPPDPGSVEEEKLQSFVDMLFGGHLASILVCEKCKKVSLTYEEFNDLSLSIKPEDYTKDRKRDRFKQFARKLRGPFRQPGARSSSVPPTDRLRRSIETPTHEEEPPTNEGPRRKSFDHTTGEEVEQEEREEARDEVKELVQVGGSPPSAAVDEAETGAEASDEKDDQESDLKGEEGKKDKGDHWGRLGRRLSVSVRMSMKALDPGSPSRSVERGRKVRHKDKEKEKEKDREADRTPARVAEAEAIRTSAASVGSAYDSGSDAGDQSDAAQMRLGSASPTPSPLSNPPITAASPNPRSHNIRRLTGLKGKRKKSLRPPKPSREEQAYLRQLLSDVHVASNNPFTALQQAIATGQTTTATAQAAWTKLGHLPSIEDCLRMFTAVEILDGENMVGCHRCWKIAHGLYKPRKDDAKDRGEDEDEDEAASDNEGEDEDSGNSGSSDKHGDLDSVAAQKGAASASADTFFSSPDLSGDGRVSSASTSALPNTQSASSLSDAPSDNTSVVSAPTTVSTSLSLATGDEERLERLHAIGLVGRTKPITYGGLPIPSISTTAPESSPSRSVPSADDAAPDGGGTPRRPPAKLVEVSPSDDDLLTPRGRRRSKTPDGFDAESDSSASSYESDTDVSASTSAYSDAATAPSVSLSPAVSPRASTDDLPTARPPEMSREPAQADPSSPKVSKSKQVVLRRMYKRYLIADAPPILVVHLKRFQQTSKTYSMSFSGASGVKKLDEYVSFPESLDIGPFLAPRREDYGLDEDGKVKIKHADKEQRRCMYSLYAVVVHIGNMLGGHYIAYTALPPSHSATSPPSTPAADSSTLASASVSSSSTSDHGHGTKHQQSPPRQWAYISDTVVRLTTIEEVLKAKAYICMYERI
ncbi:uncharacterized protein B0H18DRAFT_1005310 [Fomitopsis serialis]|uniref:uncharacterized protein n=1 Tax=Fomitopsis serialis TaxID=139415 RepID=UPI0020084C31|nr:uncharacterized protein B0H18DRAFT_1005310 [Neoantrodia serialis]KAH9926732.1 hypothetical protein B0H18DRAFT_1005310 [Neoantrodia serialis]